MSTFVATLINVPPESNPEYCCLSIEAEDVADATEQAEAVLAGDLHGLGWTSYADPALWGTPRSLLVDVVPEAEHIARNGQGNRRGSEDQEARFARYRAAVGG